MTVLYQNRQIRELERLAVESGISEYELMCRAGEAAFKALLARWPEAQEITVCCGKGNNGGDGLVLARLAYENGLKVTVYLAGQRHQLKGAAAQAANACEASNLPILPFPEPLLFKGEVIVDALLGSGLSGEVKAPYDHLIAAINQAGQYVLALDVPSGINVDSGEVQGTAVKANLTVTFIAPKRGLYTDKAPAYCGELIVDRLGLSESFFRAVFTDTRLLEWKGVFPLLPKRARDAHKGSYGHVLVIGGDYGMGGAVRMAAEAAARVGAGLVTVATRPEHVPIVSGPRPELMCHQVAAADDLKPLLTAATVVVIGPGLGKSDWAKSLLNKVLETDLPKVLDADSLNLLAESPSQREDWILTPHPGEASRLLGISCNEVQRDRFQAINNLQEKYQGVLVLKGVGTLIKDESQAYYVCPAGNPGMATGGMGDILSGIIGGLVAQRLSLASAAQAGVFIHSMAADRAAEEGGERGLLATDLFPHLRVLVNP
ncbi:NAD(P)H-hydrate dehydratase [Coxiella burnetii]|uniref:NAD(P)H-hydrate dehydratase n=1 Tax=Coxiella burnetii TaxID=777 RepID=UPI0021764851|nr:NAD(P)H-hydrate dehydratase [Coxiella burnetii]